ncbi:MAG: hypothetical protein ACR2PH_03665 [Desulfobulbia bacterium]
MNLFSNDPEDLIATGDDIVGTNTQTGAGLVSLSEIENRNLLAELAIELEEAQNAGASPERFKQLKSNFVFAGNMLLRAYDQKLLSEDIVLEIGQSINRCKHVCDKQILESVNF